MQKPMTLSFEHWDSYMQFFSKLIEELKEEKYWNANRISLQFNIFFPLVHILYCIKKFNFVYTEGKDVQFKLLLKKCVRQVRV